MALAPPLRRPRGAEARPKAPSRPKWLEAAGQVWGIVSLAANALWALVTPPFNWRDEFVEQAWLLTRRAAIPLGLSAFAFGYGTPGIQGALVAEMVGSIDRVGAIAAPSVLREGGIWVTGMVVAGVAGTAICADLGARKVRDELAALEVIGVDPVRTLVAPRLLALSLVTPALFTLCAITFVLGMMLAALQFGGTAAGFWATFTSSFVWIDVLANVVKTTFFGFMVALVCCYKGMTAKGGPAGVGRAVNQAVVIAFVSIWIFNYAINSFYLTTFPETQAIR